MPIIRLPDSIRDTITSALGNDLGRRIEKGHAVAMLIYKYTDAGDHEYLVELKRSENTRPLASFQGISNIADGTNLVLLGPKANDVTKVLADQIDIGDGGWVLRHTPHQRGELHDFRVEMTPPGSSAVYLALEAQAKEGQCVPMQRADLYPSQS